MSVFLRTVKTRLLWICPLAVMVSWLAVRTLSASPEARLPSMAVAGSAEIKDAALAELIGRFAAAARSAPQQAR